MESICSVTIPDGYLSVVGRFTLSMGHLEAIACAVSQALGVVDPGLYSVSVAVHRALQQAEFAMPPWAQASVGEVRAWIGALLELLPERNCMMHWAITDWPTASDAADQTYDGTMLVLSSPHELEYVPTGIDHVRGLVARTELLIERGSRLYDALCCPTDDFGLIDPMASPDGTGSGEVGFCFGIDLNIWPHLDQREGGKSRRRPVSRGGEM